MNTQSPLVPQGSLLEQKNKGRARVKIAVFFVLAIHGIGLLALLMQGCRREPVVPAAETTNATPVLESSNVVADANPSVVQSNPTPVVAISPAASVGAIDYKIVQGDTFSTLAKKFSVTVKAIADANPGVDSTKLQIGRIIHIPPALPASPPATVGTSTVTASGEHLYIVKSGDTLIKIAGQFGSTVKAIRSANDLKTDSIKVGQKLKIPAKGSGSAPGSTSPSEPASPGAAPAPAAAPQGR